MIELPRKQFLQCGAELMECVRHTHWSLFHPTVSVCVTLTDESLATLHASTCLCVCVCVQCMVLYHVYVCVCVQMHNCVCILCL